MLVAFKPGSDWLIANSSTNSLSLIQWRLATSPLRRYATTPPPKLVAPISRNSTKMSLIGTPADSASTAGSFIAG